MNEEPPVFECDACGAKFKMNLEGAMVKAYKSNDEKVKVPMCNLCIEDYNEEHWPYE